ncbi:MAG: S41 family peptidase [Oscillospiraceae bacterium]|nr:S41 family peptidase [Oscillospiraceae bacterium]
MKQDKKILIIGFVALLLFTNIFSFLFGGIFSRNIFGSASTSSNANDQYSKLNQVRSDLEKMYDGNVDDSSLMEGAVKGMADSLGDPYTVYMNAQEYSDFNSQSSGQFSGIGVQILANHDINKIVVAAVFKNSPAEGAGVKVNDYIVKVGDVDVDATSSDKAVSLMRGPEGTNVTVTIYREGTGNITLTMKRAIVTVNTVTSEMISDKVGYITVSMFDANTSANFKNALNDLKGKGMTGLILDLRDNPGGLVDQCVAMASNFIKRGDVVVSTKGKASPEEKLTSAGGNFIGLPMVILMNGNSASASEIFIGAMIDYKLATTVGTKSFGKGIVQTTHSYPDGTALKVTICKYYTPSGNNIQGIGFQPDINVEYPADLLQQTYNRDTDPQFQKALETINSKI